MPKPIYERTLRAPAFVYRRTAGNDASSLFCEQVELARLAARYGTPLYVYSAESMRARLHAFDTAFRSIPHTICYSVKANSTLAILRLVAAQGAGFDVVSGGELERVLRVKTAWGGHSRRPDARKRIAPIVFSGVGKTVPEMELALASNILLFNIESASELETLAAAAARLKKRASVALRVNPDVSARTHPYISTGLHEHKFGVPISEARRLYAEAAKHSSLRVAGVSVHIGSQITDLTSFTDALHRVAALVRDLRRARHTISYVDAGGGLGIPYDAKQEGFAELVTGYAGAVIDPLRQLGVHLLLEPGRSIVGPAGVLLTRVLYRKQNNGKRFLIVDAAMNDLLRPSLYGAHHEIVPVSRAAQRGTELTDIVGPICETGDFFGRDRELPITEEGSLLAILDTGAYGAVLASNYNTRGRPAEVLVDGADARVIRKREAIRDLLRGET